MQCQKDPHSDRQHAAGDGYAGTSFSDVVYVWDSDVTQEAVLRELRSLSANVARLMEVVEQLAADRLPKQQASAVAPSDAEEWRCRPPTAAEIALHQCSHPVGRNSAGEVFGAWMRRRSSGSRATLLVVLAVHGGKTEECWVDGEVYTGGTILGEEGWEWIPVRGISPSEYVSWPVVS